MPRNDSVVVATRLASVWPIASIVISCHARPGRVCASAHFFRKVFAMAIASVIDARSGANANT